MPARPSIGELTPPDRTLMGPGPSDVHPRVLRAMSTPLIGHLDPAFIELMDETQELLRYVFRTDNEWTIPVSGTGSAAMEAAIGNLVEPGDDMLVPTNGYFGDRMARMAERAGGNPVEVHAPWGEPLAIESVKDAIDRHDPAVFGFVHAETSTGVLQENAGELAGIARDNGVYTIVDCVTSLGGVDVSIDDWGVDVAYAGPQKCLSCPPGASPLTLNERAMAKVRSRDTQVRSWYLDLSLLEAYWGDDRSYHHTAPITNVYALREALRLVREEGLNQRWDRHRSIANQLRDGLQALGLRLNPDPEYWLPTLNAVRVPNEVDDAAVIAYLIEEHDIEIASGLGDLAGEVWRIGCMGHSARRGNVTHLLTAMEEALAEQGYVA